MAGQYASGKYALGVCDRCGQQFKLKVLREETYEGRPTGVRVCDACWDPEHPQDSLRGMKSRLWDPEALRNARPDTTYASSGNSAIGSRDIFWGWDPVGFSDPYGLFTGNNTLVAVGAVGTVTVVTG